MLKSLAELLQNVINLKDTIADDAKNADIGGFKAI